MECRHSLRQVVCLQALAVSPRTCPHSRRHIWLAAHHLKECHPSPSRRRVTQALLLEVCPSHPQAACHLEGHPEARLVDILLDRRDVRSDPKRKWNLQFASIIIISMDKYSVA